MRVIDVKLDPQFEGMFILEGDSNLLIMPSVPIGEF